MEIDESIVLLGEELDAWREEFSPMLDSEDRGAQALVRRLLPDADRQHRRRPALPGGCPHSP
jgi:hypothetical protein